MQRNSGLRVSFALPNNQLQSESLPPHRSSLSRLSPQSDSRDFLKRRSSRVFQSGEMLPRGVILCLQRSDTLQDVFEFLTAAGLHPSGYQPRAVFTARGDPVRDASLLVNGVSYFVTSGRAPSCFNLVPSTVFRDFLEGVCVTGILSLYFYITNKIFSLIHLPAIPSVVAQLVLLRFALKRVAKCVIFPGCTRIWKFSLQEQLATPVLHSLKRLLGRHSENVHSGLDGLIAVLRRQDQTKTLTPPQREFLQALEKGGRDEVIRLIDKNLDAYNSKTAAFNNQAPIIHGLDFMRAQLELSLNAKNFTVNRVDVILVPAPSPEQPRVSADAKVVLFCNPNAGFFETLAVNPEFVELYASLGYSFCSFNYRGYNRSSGWPSSANIAADAAEVLSFLKTHLGFKRIGVHGRSIGGICAAHLGSVREDLDFVVADRTFSKLSRAAQAMLGRWAQWGVTLLGEDSDDLGQQWLNVRCPKIVIQADDDEIIRPSAALTTAVAKRLASLRLDSGTLTKLATCVTSLVFGSVDVLARTVGRPYTLTEDTKNTRQQVRDAVAEVLGLPDVDRYCADDIEGVVARVQVWEPRLEAIQTWRALGALLSSSDQPEAEVVRTLLVQRLVDFLEKGERSDVDLRGRGLLVRTNGGHNDTLSTREKATLAEFVRSIVKESI